MNLSTIFILINLLVSSGVTENLTDIPVLDVTKNYPEKEIYIQDIASIDYIPLETTEQSLLDNTSLISSVSISEKYILVCDKFKDQGTVMVFDRQGKFLHRFNKLGGAGHEYASINECYLNPDTEEIHITDFYNTGRIQVYSINGTHKRTMTIRQDPRRNALMPLDGRYFICRNNYASEKEPRERYQPYFLFDKENGQITNLDLFTRKNISERITFPHEGGTAVMSLNIHPIGLCQPEAIIADFGSDTIFSLNNTKLTPIIRKTPSVYIKEPHTAVAVNFVTDRYISFAIADLVFDVTKTKFEAKEILYDRKEQTFFGYKIKNREHRGKEAVFEKSYKNSLPQNILFGSYSADKLKEADERKELSGRLKEIAENLEEDDNPVLVIYTMK